MRIKHFYHIAMLLAVGMAISCAKDKEPEPHATDLPYGEAYITDSVRYEENHMTAYNFAYPSKDPYGNDIMLSGTITLGDSVKAHAYAKALLLYNHYTVYRADQCPSKGNLTEQKFIASQNLITISPDYYGFGSTGHHNQAYCLSQANAQASVDALLAAKKIMSAKGYSWGDMLFNIGYSQGGQTSMGVVRLVAEKYPDIHITYTFAGAGSYDLPETYRQFFSSTIAGMPSTVVSVLLAYNEFKGLGASRNQMFKEPVLSHIDDWILSKRYTREEIDNKIGTLSFAEYIADEMIDTTSNFFLKFHNAFDQDNICKGWTPRGNEKIMLFHSSKDITVPVANTENLYNFLISNGVPESNIDLQIHDIEGNDANPAHEKAATTFSLLTLTKMVEMLNNQ